jgi:hypothetical protein
MKKFLTVVTVVFLIIGTLAACAPFQDGVEEYARTLPGWAIIVGAVVIFLIGFGIIWKLIPGFVKVLAVIALAAILAVSAWGLWESPWADKANELNHKAEEIRNELLGTPSASPD